MHATDFNALSYFQKLGKGQPVAGIVEAVMNGSLLKICLLPEFQYVTVALCGVQCPGMGRRAQQPAPEDQPVVNGDDKAAPKPAAPLTAAEVAAGAAPATGVQAQPEPFAREAKNFAEMRALNRCAVSVNLMQYTTSLRYTSSVLDPHVQLRF